MSTAPATGAEHRGFPRFFTIGGRSVNSYKVFLCVGIYVGTLATAALAGSSGLSPLGIGLAAMTSALAGSIGARLYFLLMHAPVYARLGSIRALWDSSQGGWSLFGALLTFAPASYAAASSLHIPAAVLWDHIGVGVLAGGFWVRLGCVFNGCCGGRHTKARLRVWLHDTRGVRKPRIPVQFLEMAWWFVGLVAFLVLWPGVLPQGSYALAVLAWYGVGRSFLEPLREHSDVAFRRVRINQAVAAVLALSAGGALVFRSW
jgi:phosphatidylglycerol---prolipoprotein diacylglyceryl transferase